MRVLNKLIYTTLILSCVSADYLSDRNAFIKEEESEMLGSRIVLTRKEELANQVLMKYKLKEYEEGFVDPAKFNPRRHFFDARKDIEASEVFKIIRKMPKGAALHLHSLSEVSQEYFMNATYKENVYACTISDELHLKFLRDSNQDTSCNWMLVKTLRQMDPNFDNHVRSQFFLNVANPFVVYPDTNVVWKRMMNILQRSNSFFAYEGVFQEHFYEVLREMYVDNVRYCEYRTTFPNVHKLNGESYNASQKATLYQQTIDKFKRDYPDFVGIRLIYTMARSGREEFADANNFQTLLELHNLFPNIIAGFDVCGQEDLGKSTVSFQKLIATLPSSIKRFLHAGETNWFGATDENLVDAILLNASRIGHGFAVVKHPLVLKYVKRNNIAIEVCPISNQVLRLVEDIRNHPAAYLLAHGYPVVIGSDNGMLWGSTGLSYDYYMTFMGMTSKTTGLKLLKQLFLNSLEYSAMTSSEKSMAIELWKKDWDTFIDNLIK